MCLSELKWIEDGSKVYEKWVSVTKRTVTLLHLVSEKRNILMAAFVLQMYKVKYQFILFIFDTAVSAIAKQ